MTAGDPGASGGRLEAGLVVASRFVLVAPLGAGAFGAVWSALDRDNLDARVALKFLHGEAGLDVEVVRRFAVEARLLARFNHPNIAQPISWGQHEGRPYLALEFVDGVSLEAFLTSRGTPAAPLDAATVTRVFTELCTAVEYAHSQGVVHRDLKPENVMILDRGGALYVKLLDLGVARIVSGPVDKHTTTGRIIGSPLYMAPEQWKGEPADPRADVFALGAILFELLTRRKAWMPEEEVSIPALFQRVMAGPRPDPGAWRPELPPALRALVQQALDVDPARRPPSVGELLRAYRSALEPAPEPVRASLPEPVRETMRARSPEPVRETTRARSPQVPPTTGVVGQGVVPRANPRGLAALAAGVMGGVVIAWWVLAQSGRTAAPRADGAPAGPPRNVTEVRDAGNRMRVVEESIDGGPKVIFVFDPAKLPLPYGLYLAPGGLDKIRNPVERDIVSSGLWLGMLGKHADAVTALEDNADSDIERGLLVQELELSGQSDRARAAFEAWRGALPDSVFRHQVENWLDAQRDGTTP